MTNKLKQTAAATSNAAAEQGGVWVEYARVNEAGKIDTYRVKLSRAGTMNAQFQKVGSDLTKKFRKSGTEVENIDLETQRKITSEIYARTIVKDWNADDFGVSFSVEECIDTFSADNDFLDFCISEAGKASVFRKEVVQAETGNS